MLCISLTIWEIQNIIKYIKISAIQFLYSSKSVLIFCMINT